MLPSQILEGIPADWLHCPRRSALARGQALKQFIRREHAAIGATVGAASVERLVSHGKRVLALPADDAILGPLEATDPALAALLRRQHGRRTKVYLYNKAPVLVGLPFDCDGAASGQALWLDINRGQVKPVQDSDESFRWEPAASDHTIGADKSGGRQVALVVEDDAILGPLEPIDPIVALAHHHDILKFELEHEEPPAGEGAPGGIDSVGGQCAPLLVPSNIVPSTMINT